MILQTFLYLNSFSLNSISALSCRPVICPLMPNWVANDKVAAVAVPTPIRKGTRGNDIMWQIKEICVETAEWRLHPEPLASLQHSFRWHCYLFFLSFFLSFLFSSSFFSTCLFSSMNIEILDIYYSIFILAAVESNPSHHMQQFTFHLLRHGHIHTLSYTSSIVHVNPLELNRLVFLTSLSLASPRLRVLLCSL